jgi:hypothetical protein
MERAALVAPYAPSAQQRKKGNNKFNIDFSEERNSESN